MDESLEVIRAVLDPKRLDALREIDLLDTPPEKAFDRLTDLVRRLLGVPVSLVSLVDEDRQFFKSSCGLDEPLASQRQTPLSHSFCKHVVASGEPLIVENARVDEVVRENLAIRDLGVVAYLGIPLRTPDGHVVGSLCAVDGVTRTWTAEDVDVLESVAASVMNEIAIRLQVLEIETYAIQLRESSDTLQRYAGELEVANATKDRFFSIIAHDLRSPLQTLVGYCGALVEETGTEPGSQAHLFAGHLENAIGKMSRFLDNLLQWSRVQIGSVACRPRIFNLSEELREAVDIVAAQAERKRVELVADLPKNFEVESDPDCIRCIVHNLLTNAIKFTPADGKVCLVVKDLGERFEIAVEDDGVGMSNEALSRLFHIDQKVSTRGTDGEKGTGLGLILCRELVELGGGTIQVSSTLGRGTQISFCLPAQREGKTGRPRTASGDRVPSTNERDVAGVKPADRFPNQTGV